MADVHDRGAWADAPPTSESSAFKFDATQNSESIPELLRDLVHQGSHLAEQQVKLVQAEVRSGSGKGIRSGCVIDPSLRRATHGEG